MSATLRFLRLLWIDVRRIHGYVPVVLVWVLTPFATYDYERFGIVLWADADRELFATVLYLTAIGGGYGAWVAGRIARRQLQAQDATLPAPAGRTTAIALVAAGCWMTVAYLGAAAWFFQAPLREATWGAPNLALAIPVLGATWFAVGLGGVLGSLHRSLLIPPLVTAGIFGLQTWGQVDVWKRPTFQLIPMGYLEENRWWRDFDGFDPHGLGTYSMMLLAGAVVAFVVVLLVRRLSILRVLVAIAALVIAVPNGQHTLTARMETGSDGRYESPVERVCETAPLTGVQVCLHPAFTKAMEDVVAAVDETYGPIASLAGVPTMVYQMSASSGPTRRNPVLEIYLSTARADYLPYDLVSGLFVQEQDFDFATWPGPDPVECFMMTVLLPKQFQEFHACEHHLQGMPTEGLGFDIEVRQADLDRIPAKVETWNALTQEQQRAWLEANWDALRAGELTLEDLP